MKAQISFRFINPDYSQEYADQYQGGKESESNWKYNKAVGWEVKDVSSVELMDDAVYHLSGDFKEGGSFDIPISNVKLLRCHKENGDDEDFAVSKSIYNHLHQTESKNHKIIYCYFYINSEPPGQVFDTVALAINEIPEELIERKNDR